jgi:hypothetical protein
MKDTLGLEEESESYKTENAEPQTSVVRSLDWYSQCCGVSIE